MVISTTYSLAIVGLTALAGTLRYHRHINFTHGLYFVIPSVLGVFSTRFYLLPHLPPSLGGLSLDQSLMLLLVGLMLISSYFMIAGPYLQPATRSPINWRDHLKVSLLGLSLGAVMGVMGAGGGFLIIPVLVLLVHMPMSQAVPTSLFVITINSLAGFAADRHHFSVHDWHHIAGYVSIALVGMLVGVHLSPKIAAAHLKRSFGGLILVIATIISVKEFFLN